MLTEEELEQYRTIVRRAAMRYPATMANVPAAGKALVLTNAPWFDEHLRLARIEQAGAYGDEEWAGDMHRGADAGERAGWCVAYPCAGGA